ncbi:zinc finger protein 428-like isoform X1 [Anolis sagrei]|uniref:zinc finger protein 428-like isoform X1 n=2 Tax=Anolis sagrei TaxID=38937 RepID=UPI003521DDE3
MMAEDEEKARQEKAEGGATAMQALRQEDSHPEDVVEGEEEEEEEDEEEEEGEGAAASEATSISSGASRAPSPAATTTAAANGFPGPRGAKEAPGGPAGELPDTAGAVTGEDRLSSASQEPPSPEWHECPECGRGFGTSRALKVHRSYHIGRKRPHGGGGGSGPPSSPSLLGPPGAKAPPPPEGPPSRGRAFHYICAECGLGFASPASLEGHRCEHGWRQRGVPGALPRHKPVPSPSPAPAGGQANGGTEEEEEAEGEGPYHCTECPGEFGLVSQLHQHYMLHARGEL